MTPDQVQQLLDNVIQEVNAAADFAGIIDPALIPFIAIGRGVDKLIPGFAASVTAWIAGNPPTDAEKADFAKKLSVLSDPHAP